MADSQNRMDITDLLKELIRTGRARIVGRRSIAPINGVPMVALDIEYDD